jgi:hypothetical protein
MHYSFTIADHHLYHARAKCCKDFSRLSSPHDKNVWPSKSRFISPGPKISKLQEVSQIKIKILIIADDENLFSTAHSRSIRYNIREENLGQYHCFGRPKSSGIYIGIYQPTTYPIILVNKKKKKSKLFLGSFRLNVKGPFE